VAGVGAAIAERPWRVLAQAEAVQLMAKDC